MSLFISDKIEKPLEAILADLQKREPVIADKLERFLDEVRPQVTSLLIEVRAELAAWKAIRERLFHP